MITLNKLSSIVGLFVALCTVFVPSIGLYAQCEGVIKKAEVSFDEGHIREAQNLLTEECLKSFEKKSDKIRGYYLLTLCSLYLNEKQEATKMMLKLLALDPEYAIDETQPVEFRTFHQSFKVSPVTIIGFKVGVNSTNFTPLKSYSLDNINNSLGNYASAIRFQAGLSYTIHLKSWLQLSTEVYYKSVRYTFSNRLFNYANNNITETQNFVEVPILFKFNAANLYNFTKDRKKMLNRLNPYATLGASGMYLLGANVTARRNDISAAIEVPLNLETQQPLPIDELRQPLNYFLVGGAGIEYKKGRGILVLDFRYHYNMMNIVNTKNRYTNNALLFQYGYVDSDLRLHNMSFSIGYAYPLYKAKPKIIY